MQLFFKFAFIKKHKYLNYFFKVQGHSFIHRTCFFVPSSQSTTQPQGISEIPNQ